jgi:excisionase family DNA binding protein
VRGAERHNQTGVRCQIMTDRAESRSLFLSIPSAAKLMGITPERLTRAIAAHQIPAITIGSRRLIPRRTIERLAELVKGDVA